MYSFGVSFNLPLQRERRHAMVAESASEQLMATADLNMQHNQIRFSIADSLARLESSSKLAMLYREGILPQAGNALEAAMAAYRVGKADFMNVLDSQMRQFNYEREYYDAVADHEMQLAQLERVVGTALPFVVK
jgi:outer membrane protein TolC